jgi:UDP-glucuronate 4-epimerase
VKGFTGEVRVAIGISGAVARLSPQGLEEKSRLVPNAAERISAQFGFGRCAQAARDRSQASGRGKRTHAVGFFVDTGPLASTFHKLRRHAAILKTRQLEETEPSTLICDRQLAPKGKAVMTILVTGSMGHVGFEVVRQAVRRDHKVVAVYRGVSRPRDAEALGRGVTWVRADLSDEAAIAAMADANAIKGVIHAAAVPNDSVARPDPLGAVRSNVGSVAGLLDQARRRGWRRFVNVGTGSVFQNATDPAVPILEDHPPAVTNVYSTTKYCGELLTAMYRSQFDVSAATVRISWVYGQPLVPRHRENPRGPIPWLLKCALSGVPIEEASGSEFLASYTHVADVAAGLLAAYEADALRHSVYHLGWGRNFSTTEVVRAVRAAVPNAIIAVGPGTAPWTDHTKMRGPLAGSRLLDDTGFKPSLDLDRGVASFADWMRRQEAEWK